MSQRGKPSTAHDYKNGQCLWCGMYKVNVDKMSHECTAAREARQDELERISGAQANLAAAEKGD